MRWRPASEAEATSNQTAFVEWLRATRVPDATPALVESWLARPQAGPLLPAVETFLGLSRASGVAGALQERSVVRHAGPCRVEIPASIAWDSTSWQGARGWDALLACATSHLLLAETRADDRLLWLGDNTDAWPVAGVLLGATVIFAAAARDPVSMAQREAATAIWRAAPAFPTGV